MKVVGFTIVKNAVVYQYPVLESIRSVLPVCDEFLVAVGACDDGTLQLIKSMAEPKIKIIETVWNERPNDGTHVLAVETNKAMAHIAADADWLFYIQADEVIHERYLPNIQLAMRDNLYLGNIDGLLFNYLHFYGSYDYVATSSNWYSHEIRVFKNNKAIYSYGDAQGFRKGDNEKLIVKSVAVCVHHYGWTREPEALKRKQANFYAMYPDAYNKPKDFDKTDERFEYEKFVTSIKAFKASHPAVIAQLIKNKNWKFNYDISMDKKSNKDLVKQFLRDYLGINTYYTNYKISKN